MFDLIINIKTIKKPSYTVCDFDDITIGSSAVLEDTIAS